MSKNKIIDMLEQLAHKKGLSIIDKGNGHFQIIGGPLTVNYYPFSKNQTAYVSSTQKGRTCSSPLAAIEMAFMPPPLLYKKVERKNPSHYKRQRKWLLKYSQECYWCCCMLTLETSTLDHKIPLKRGGLDNRNNYVLSCKKCNQDRGHFMPELEHE